MREVSQLVACFGLCVVSSIAFAAEPLQVNTRLVRYGDLDLETRQGAAELYSRLNNAARRVCVDYIGTIDLTRRRVERQCVRDAIAVAVSKVNRPSLTAYYRVKSGVKDEQVLSKL